MSKNNANPADFIIPININGLDGRNLYLKAANKSNKKEILVVYDLRSNLERWWGLDSALKQYGNVTAVDLPGFGGMDSFYNLGLKPTLNNFADYLASFVKLKYKKKKLYILGVGFGFAVATRMLQRNPEIIPKVYFVIGINAYAHSTDLKINKRNKARSIIESSLLALPLVPRVAKLASYNKAVINYKNERQSKTKKFNQFELNFKMDIDKETDFRTRKYIIKELSKLDNCNKRIDLPLWHVIMGKDNLVADKKIAEQHLRVIYSKYRQVPSKTTNVPFIINNARLGSKILPAALRRELKKPVH